MLVNLAQNCEGQNKLSGVFVGVVVSTTDSLKLSRVKCTIAGLIESTNVNLLPYFTIRNSVMFGGLASTQFQMVPDVNSKVLIQFQNNDVYSGEILGYWDDSATHNSALDENYPASYGFLDIKGNIFKVNRVTGEIKITHNAGTEIIVHPDGHIELGIDSSEYIVMSTKLKDWISNEIDAKYNSHTHPLPAALATTITVIPGIPPIGAITGIVASTLTPTPTMILPTEADLASEQHKVGN